MAEREHLEFLFVRVSITAKDGPHFWFGFGHLFLLNTEELGYVMLGAHCETLGYQDACKHTHKRCIHTIGFILLDQ